VARLREIRREFERGLLGTRAPASYLHTLTLVDPPQFTLVADSLRPRGAAAPSGAPAETPKAPAGKPAASEVFVSAQPVWRASDGGTSASSLSPAGVPRSNRAVILSGAIGIAAAVVASVVVLAFLLRPPADGEVAPAAVASTARSAAALAASGAGGPAAPPGPAETALAIAPSATPAASAPAGPATHEARADGHGPRRAERPAADAGAPVAPPAAVTTGITTQKDWF